MRLSVLVLQMQFLPLAELMPDAIKVMKGVVKKITTTFIRYSGPV